MNNKLISIEIIGLLIIGGFLGFMSINTMDTKGSTIVTGIAYDGLAGPTGGPWTMAGSPYIVVGDVIVPEGETLTIEPGVHVKFDGCYNIFVNGTLIAVGNGANKINFTSNMSAPKSGDWNRIRINSTGHAKIKYCEVSYSKYGIYLESSFNNITNNDVLDNWYGIRLSSSSNNNITGNNVTNNDNGIFLELSSNNTISGNNVSYNNYGINLYLSPNNNITYNDLFDDGVVIIGIQLSHFNSHYIPTNNKVNSEPIRYYKDSSGLDIDGITAGQLIIANCTYFNVRNIQINDIDYGIQVAYSSNISITDNYILDNRKGIYITSSSNNTIANNNISSSYYQGLHLYSSSNNTIEGNNITLCDFSGIHLEYSDGNYITGNNASGNRHGIYISGSSNNTIICNNFSNSNAHGIYLYSSSNNEIIDNNIINNWQCGIKLFFSNINTITDNDVLNSIWEGIYLYESSNNTITNNNASDNLVGIYLVSSSDNNIFNNVFNDGETGIVLYWSSNSNQIRGNNITSNTQYGIQLESSPSSNVITANNISLNNWVGVYLISSSNNKIYHNNFIENTNQAYDDMDNNFWNDTYPSAGNYWSDYGGVDNFKGPKQNIPGSDCIGDTPYLVSLDAQDNYPLMAPYKPLENYTILRQGWNLISIPLIQEEQNLTRVLGSIDGWYDTVWWHNTTAINDHWGLHNTGKPFGNDLFELNQTMGFWIHIVKPGDTIFLYNGTQLIQNKTINLYIGWNLVGYPSSSNKTRTEALNNLTFGTHVDSIWTFNASSQIWQEIGNSDYFELGRGYWVHAKTKCVWYVPL